jgi:hypothetical protein
VCAALVAFPVVQLQAQSTFGVLVGVSTGKMMEEFEGEDFLEGEEGLMGLTIGITMRRAVGTNLMFAPEVIFTTKGASDDDSDGKLAMSYIEVPLLFRYGFQTAGMIKPFLTAGPEVGFQLSCDYEDTAGNEASCDDEFGEDDSYDKFDAGIVLGGGVSRDKLSLNIRYDLGLMNIAKTDGWTSKHKVWMILLGYDF